ncbi:hypothetical protein H8K33_06995 [Undibacterium amnicola]|jgi:hypothetical protein|uniref:Uncharacterized protein n=1 Tax=Undibacterium amnicola TaxID=1834038 RepID=A0ABR6XPD6_9BURK|nr:hypothetical protein [Undibacterium amnicola]MBC3831248.1 hypothetical protein [Undibacterium amnicola]
MLTPPIFVDVDYAKLLTLRHLARITPFIEISEIEQQTFLFLKLNLVLGQKTNTENAWENLHQKRQRLNII